MTEWRHDFTLAKPGKEFSEKWFNVFSITTLT
jgi:hypothetical protein